MKRIWIILASCCLSSCSPTRNHPLCGKWVGGPHNGPLGMFLTLSENGSFVMGGIDGGKEYPGISGTWKANKATVTLKVLTSKSCKVREGQEIELAYRMIGDQELGISEPGSKEDARRLKRHPQPVATPDEPTLGTGASSRR